MGLWPGPMGLGPGTEEPGCAPPPPDDCCCGFTCGGTSCASGKESASSHTGHDQRYFAYDSVPPPPHDDDPRPRPATRDPRPRRTPSSLSPAHAQSSPPIPPTAPFNHISSRRHSFRATFLFIIVFSAGWGGRGQKGWGRRQLMVVRRRWLFCFSFCSFCSFWHAWHFMTYDCVRRAVLSRASLFFYFFSLRSIYARERSRDPKA
jgi:hypothetical protein